MISKVWGGGKGTVSGASDASFKGLSGTAEDFGSGVAAVGDLEAIADLSSRLALGKDVKKRLEAGTGVKCLGKTRNAG
jgi:hypothetical protein